ncbi:MAG: hypothetical protein Kow0063_19360 [Anaerolineae bacterium]
MKRAWLLTPIVLVLAGLCAVVWGDAWAAPPRQGDLAIITSPQNNAIVRGQVTILGSATHPQFQFYKVEFAREPFVGDENFAIIGAIHQEQVVDGQLEVWDTTQIPDGSYTLRLRVVKVDGNYNEYNVVQVVVANAQPTETPTPAVSPTPTISPTPLPPTPTIVIEQPALPTGAATPVPTRITPLPTPVEGDTGFNFDVTPLQTACLYGAGVSLAIFLLFGFLAALRNLIYAVLDRR